MLSPVRILVINPNSNQAFTQGLEGLVDRLRYAEASCDFFTCPEPQPPLSSLENIDRSAKLCFPHLLQYIDTHDALLVACFSRHPLVGQLQAEIDRRNANSLKPRTRAVTGILEASVATAITLAGASPRRNWGVISTDHFWRQWTDDAINDFLGVDAPRTTIRRYLGCETVGVQAEDLERQGESIMAEYAKTALERLLLRQDSHVAGAPIIILGCAGLHQLDACIRMNCKDLLGNAGMEVTVIDGVKSGIGMLVSMVKSCC